MINLPANSLAESRAAGYPPTYVSVDQSAGEFAGHEEEAANKALVLCWLINLPANSLASHLELD